MSNQRKLVVPKLSFIGHLGVFVLLCITGIIDGISGHNALVIIVVSVYSSYAVIVLLNDVFDEFINLAIIMNSAALFLSYTDKNTIGLIISSTMVFILLVIKLLNCLYVKNT